MFSKVDIILCEKLLDYVSFQIGATYLEDPSGQTVRIDWGMIRPAGCGRRRRPNGYTGESHRRLYIDSFPTERLHYLLQLILFFGCLLQGTSGIQSEMDKGRMCWWLVPANRSSFEARVKNAASPLPLASGTRCWESRGSIAPQLDILLDTRAPGSCSIMQYKGEGGGRTLTCRHVVHAMDDRFEAAVSSEVDSILFVSE
jgi:hypothetical protein